MGPPQNERSRPARNGPAKKSLDGAASVTQPDDVVRQLARQQRRELGRRTCRHGATHRPCRSCQRQRFAAQLATALANSQTSPQTFGLSEDELRAEANKLVQTGWSVDEVQSVLAVERRAS